MNSQAQPTSATQAKERNYAHLANSLTRLSRAMGQTADLFEQLQVDLDAMRTLAGIHAAQLMTVAAELNPDQDDATQDR
ncbi:hypothetical protein BV25DRAFT_1806358 [Artomyces pyxidatus]|uniref:Uncharacterized protein n=1 Tax=Artomyces pyxidatus TaxID=48021 RepID=A0ACB8SYH0_9AGAM|nr:hypothetical protein BV25DRAFT_1806358 [Artomyces pyxidatus]